MDLPLFLERDLVSVVHSQPLFSGQTLVIARNENSDLLPLSKECSQEFFENVFDANGPLWRTYDETRMGVRPFNSKHVHFVAGRMYFSRNVEKRFMRNPGIEKTFSWHSKNGLVETSPLSIENLLLMASFPFDAVGQAIDMALFALYAEQKLRAFPSFSQQATHFVSEHAGRISNPVAVSEAAQEGAVRSMQYSFVSSLASAFKTPLVTSSAWQSCEAEQLYALLSENKVDEAVERFGFHSESPYDVSIPRFQENPASAMRLMQPAPKDKYARWRENAKMVCSRYLSVLRNTYIEVSHRTGVGTPVFHARISELPLILGDSSKWSDVLAERKKRFDAHSWQSTPAVLVFSDKKWFDLPHSDGVVSGKPAGAPFSVTAECVFVNEDSDYEKNVNGKIIVSHSFSPRLSTLFKDAVGVVSETGGALSHSAIIARELRIPCIVQTHNISSLIQGRTLIMDGKTGSIRMHP
ncbi:hypothetical protein KJ765_05920 [Candidatus Micrarchaeota archaeon]|nr:hypothetical protein [Candidatus Micrarchaeota archaeon]